VHFHFNDPSDAAMASLEIVDRVQPAGLPPAHIGVNAGPMIYDEGDYFGRTVNIAARIASQAGPDQVFVGEDVLRPSRRVDCASSKSVPSRSRASRSH